MESSTKGIKSRTSIFTWLSLLASTLSLAASAAFLIAKSQIELRATSDHLDSLYAQWFWPILFLASTGLILAAICSRRNLTLINLLVVAAAILALFLLIAIVCVPTAFVDVIRNPVSCAKIDMRSLSIAIEAYYVDNNAYPVSTIDPKEQSQFAANISLPSFRKWKPGGPATLTTPIAYITSLPLDRLSTYIHKDSTFAYWAPKEGGWVLLSPGPNYVFDIDFPTLQKVFHPGGSNPTSEILTLTYDATNGSQSSGDIWRVNQ